MSTKPEKQFAKNLRQAMIKACLSVRQLADLTECSEGYIRFITKGERAPDFEDILAFAMATNTSASQLMEGL